MLLPWPCEEPTCHEWCLASEISGNDALASCRPCKQNLKGRVNVRFPVDVYGRYAIDLEA